MGQLLEGTGGGGSFFFFFKMKESMVYLYVIWNDPRRGRNA